MEEHKYRYLQDFLDRTEKNLEYYTQKIRNHKEKLLSYYPETIKSSSEDLVKIILVDSAFIIELFFNVYLKIAGRTDRILGPPRMIHDIRADLLLLENQLPFFILKDLFDPEEVNEDSATSNPGYSKKYSFIQLFRNFFGTELELLGVDDFNLETVNSSEVKGEHFLDIIRTLCLPPEHLAAGRHNAVTTVAPSITELHRAGVKLQPRSTKNLFGVQFDNGILEIPKLTIAHPTMNPLRNLAAFEQCSYINWTIGDYLDILNSFVNTPKDVELLVEYGIVTNILGDSSEACSLINSLCTRVLGNYKDFYFDTLYEDLHKHCKKPWNKWKANLRQNYLNTPWAIISVVVAAFLTILTVIQAVCSLISL